MSLKGRMVYNLYSKVTGGYIASFPRQKYCHQFVKLMKEQHFFNNGSMDAAEEKWGENTYYIEYGVVIPQSCVATQFENANFSEWP